MRPYFCGALGGMGPAMIYFAIKAAVSGLFAALISEIARRYPGWGGIVASLPVTSLMAILWLWRDTGDGTKVASLSMGIMWFILPSLPLFLIVPSMLRAGVGFWPTLATSCVVTMALYAGFFWVAPRVGIAL